MKVIDLLNKAIDKRQTLFAFELLPPLKGDGSKTVFAAIDNVLRFNPAYINITFHREVVKVTESDDGMPELRLVRRRPGTVGIAAAIQRRYGIPAVPHLICGGHSRYDLEDALIDLDLLGIDNVLALRGDKRPTEQRFMAHPEGHENAVDLVRQIADMNRGIFIDEEVAECHHSRFCIGVAGYPETHSSAFSAAEDIRRLREKVEAGAEYVVTQMFFDNAKYFDFVRKCREAGISVPIVPGLKPLVTEKQLSTLPEAFSLKIPEELRKAFEGCRGDRQMIRETGIEWTVMQCKELMAAGVPALHFYTMSKTENIARIASQIF